MLSNPEVGGATNDLLEQVSEEIREGLKSSRRILDEAAWLRATAGRHDGPLDECERTLRDKAPRGRKLRHTLSQCSEAVVEANEVHRKVLAKETEAMPLFRDAVEGVAALATAEGPISAAVLELLQDCVRLRGEAIEWRERALRNPGGILDVGAKGSADQLLALLEERRRLLKEAGSCGRKAEQLERRALRFPGSAPVEEEPQVEEDGAPVIDMELPEPAKAAAPPDDLKPGQGLLKKIAELEAELSVALRRAEVDRAEVARSSEERIRRIEGLNESSLSREKEARLAAEQALAGLEEQHRGATERLEEAAVENEDLQRRVQEADEAARAERSAHDAESSLARDRIAQLTERRDILKGRVLTAKRLQVSATRSATEETETLRSRLAEAESAAKTDRTAVEAEKKAVEAERKAAEGKLIEMRACLEELERRVDDLKTTEEELARERDELGEKLAEAERSVSEAEERLDKEAEDSRVANQERNEALALASSLIRRLESEGVPEDEVAPAKTLASELGDVREEIGAQKTELEAIKEQLDAYKSELAARIDSLKDAK